MYSRCGEFKRIIANYSITQYYIRKRTEKNTLKSHRKDVYHRAEDMDSAEELFRNFTYVCKTNVKEEVRHKWYTNKFICKKTVLMSA